MCEREYPKQPRVFRIVASGMRDKESWRANGQPSADAFARHNSRDDESRFVPSRFAINLDFSALQTRQCAEEQLAHGDCVLQGLHRHIPLHDTGR